MFSGGMEKDQWHETVLHWTKSKKWIQKQKSQKQKLDHKKWIYQQSKKSDKIKSNKSNKIWRQILKSFVRYFLKKKNYLSPNDSPSKTMQDVFYFI